MKRTHVYLPAILPILQENLVCYSVQTFHEWIWLASSLNKSTLYILIVSRIVEKYCQNALGVTSCRHLIRRLQEIWKFNTISWINKISYCSFRFVNLMYFLGLIIFQSKIETLFMNWTSTFYDFKAIWTLSIFSFFLKAVHLIQVIFAALVW